MSQLPNVAPQFADDLRCYALSLGAELFGVAAAADYAESFPGKPQPGMFMKDARSVIVIGLPYEPDTMATVLHPELSGIGKPRARRGQPVLRQPQGAERYFAFEEKLSLERELDWMGYRIAKFLRQSGWHGLHMPPSKQTNRCTAAFYHMPAMYLAGLGTLGLNCCIITPEFGPRVLVTTIITDCPLPAGKPMDKEMCSRCGLCVESCPSRAIDGTGWKNVFACQSYGCCRTCIAVCPSGKLKPPKLPVTTCP